MSNNIVVISHYDHDVSWINNINIPYIIYSKTNNPCCRHIDINSTQVNTVYLKYIIDFYDNLSDKILFVHGHKTLWHQTTPIDYIISNLNWDLDEYFSINDREIYQEITSEFGSKVEPNAYQWIKENWSLFENYLPLPNKLLFYSACQFVVSKKLVLQYPIEFYKKLYLWSVENKLGNYIGSRIFEYTWHYIFTKNPIEKIHDSILL